MGQDITDNSGLSSIISQLARRGSSSIEEYKGNPKFEVLTISDKVLKAYCELIEIDYWTLICNVIQLCVASKQQELERYGKEISNIEGIHLRIEANKEIKDYQVPDEIHKGTIENEEGETIPFNKTFSQMFNIEEIENDKVRFTVIVKNSYPTKEQVIALKNFKENNLNLNVEFL